MTEETGNVWPGHINIRRTTAAAFKYLQNCLCSPRNHSLKKRYHRITFHVNVRKPLPYPDSTHPSKITNNNFYLKPSMQSLSCLIFWGDWTEGMLMSPSRQYGTVFSGHSQGKKGPRTDCYPIPSRTILTLSAP